VRQWINSAVQVVGTLAVLAYAYLMISFPDGYQISRFSLQLRLFVLGVVAALIMRTFWSLALLPTAIIVGMIAAGIHAGLIQSFQQMVAASVTVEVFTLPATVLGAFLATLLPRLLVRGVRALRRVFTSVAPVEQATTEQAPTTLS